MTILERLRRLAPPTEPRWLLVAFAPALLGHGLAGVGLYWDIAWHIDVGRDERLLTTPHTLILAGLLLLAVSSVAGLFTAARAGVRLPRGLLAAAFSAGIAVLGFPLDELWHQANGVDVTLWSPTHILMVGGGALSVLPLWFALGEAGVRPRDGARAWLAHATAAMVTLGGLSAFQGEFDFGVPQFQLLYHPVLAVVSPALVLTAARALLGRGGALIPALMFLAFRGFLALVVGVAAGRTAPTVALYLGTALIIEGVARIRPPERGTAPFALLAGAAAATLGLATEWLWAGLVARHPWTVGLLPDAVIVPMIGALGAGLLGTGIAAALRPGLTPPNRWLLAAAGGAVLVALLAPLPRTAQRQPQAAVSFQREGDEAKVRVVIGPPDAPYRARWWEVMAWQGGGLDLEPLIAGEGSGVYETRGTVPITGDWKVMLRLHRGSDILAAMLRRPADPAYELEAIEPTDRFVTMEGEEANLGGGDPDAPAALGSIVIGATLLAAAGWLLVTVRAAKAARTSLAPPAPARGSKAGGSKASGGFKASGGSKPARGSQRGGRKLRQR